MSIDLEILQIILDNNTSYAAYRKQIKDQLPHIHLTLEMSEYRYAEAIYMLLNGLSERPGCLECNTPLKYIDRSEGYRTFCSTRCAGNNNETKKKRKETVERVYQGNSSASTEKRKKTMVERYGVEHALQNKKLSEQAKHTYSQNSQTEILAKRKNTIQTKYGVESLWDLPEFREKVQQGNLKNHGFCWPQQNKEITDKGLNTRKKIFYDKLSDRCPNAKPLFDNFISVDYEHKWQCKTCNHIFLDHIDDGSQPLCDRCFPKQANSLGEKEIIKFLKDIGISNIVINDRTLIRPKEIDIFVPELNLAIEYCGLYWHSEKKVSRDYHKTKLDLCNKIGIQLITIFEDEWLNKNEICKNRIRYLVKKMPTTCYARQTIVSTVPAKDAKEFAETHHIQGYNPASIKIGLYFNNKLVSLMTFGKPRAFMNLDDDGFEILRFCSNGNVPGAAQKLFSYFIKTYNPSKIISYCDLRWGTGLVYKTLGMELEKITSPGYWYTKDGLSRLHRFNYSKGKLINLGYDSSMTESEITKQMGLYKVWDCGNLKFVWQQC